MNKSNWIHAGAAVLIALPFLLVTPWLPWFGWLGAIGSTFFFIGVEWMQEIRIHVKNTGREWPAKLDLMDVIYGFAWANSDRYWDWGLGAIITSILAAAAQYVFR